MKGSVGMVRVRRFGKALAKAAATVVCLGLGASLAWAQVPRMAPALSLPLPHHPIFVLNSLDATISVIDPITYQEIRRVPTGKEPHHLYLTPDEKSLIVANSVGDSMTMMDPQTGAVQRVVENVSDPYQLRFSRDMRWLVTAGNRLNHVDVYRSTPRPGGGVDLKLAKRIPTGRTPSHVNIDSESRVAYATMQDSDELIAIDLLTLTQLWRVHVGRLPADIFLTPDNHYIMVALTGDRFVEVYDLRGPRPVLFKRIETGDGAHAFRAWGDKQHVLLSNRAGNTISKIDMRTMQVVATYPAPGGPDCMDLLADGRTLLVTSRWARKLTVIDTVEKKVIRQVPVGRSPHGVWTLDHAPQY